MQSMLMGLKQWNLSVEEHLICGECGDVLDGAEMPVDMPAASPELLLIFWAWFLNRPVSNKSSDPKSKSPNMSPFHGQSREPFSTSFSLDKESCLLPPAHDVGS